MSLSRFPLLLLAALALPLGPLGGCASAQAEDWTQLPPLSVAATRAELQGAHARLDAWTDAERVAARAAAAELLVNCPFNRAAAQAPLALELSLGELEGRGLSPEQQAELRAMQDGLVVHRALVERVAGELLPAPAMVDHLDTVDPALLPSERALAADPDPLLRTRALVFVIPDVVAAYPPSVAARAEELSEDLRALTVAPTGREQGAPPTAWPYDRVLQGWHHTLTALLPAFDDPEEQRRVLVALGMLDSYMSSHC